MGYRLSKIYTRTGDDGTTSLGPNNRLPKNHVRIEALGSLDELNSAIGVVVSFIPEDSEIANVLHQIQNDLFDLGGELCPPYYAVIHAGKISDLENILDRWNDTLPPLKEFILPGGNPAISFCHLARAICRRTERSLVALNFQEKIDPDILRYINRLSDLLFVAARMIGRNDHSPEILWQHQRKKT